MDQIRIGKFIAQCRKDKKMTQAQLAEKLDITDRAVSKWENGKAMPDSAIMLDLCDLLDITVNDLLSGEKVSSEDYSKKLEEKLVETINEKEMSDKLLVFLRNGILILTVLTSISVTFVTWNIYEWWVMPFVLFWNLICFCMIGIGIALDRKAGYYKCENCGKTYIPTWKEWFWAWGPSYKRIRMKCRYCNQKTYHTKTLRKE